MAQMSEQKESVLRTLLRNRYMVRFGLRAASYYDSYTMPYNTIKSLEKAQHVCVDWSGTRKAELTQSGLELALSLENNDTGAAWDCATALRSILWTNYATKDEALYIRSQLQAYTPYQIRIDSEDRNGEWRIEIGGGYGRGCDLRVESGKYVILVVAKQVDNVDEFCAEIRRLQDGVDWLNSYLEMNAPKIDLHVFTAAYKAAANANETQETPSNIDLERTTSA